MTAIGMLAFPIGSGASTVLGLGLILTGGACNGSFAVPTKRITFWSFEHIWLVYSLFATVLLPTGVGLAVAPVLFKLVFRTHPLLTAQAFGFGILWGAGSVLFALSLKRLGIAISDALTNGTVVLFGSTGPLVIGAVSLTARGFIRFTLGLSLLILGISACAWASVQRDKTGNLEMRLAPSITSWLGISLAVLAGLVSSMLNIGFAHGRPLIDMTIRAGVAPSAAALAIWIPALAGGFVVNLAFTSFQIQRDKSWSKFAQGRVNSGSGVLPWDSYGLPVSCSTALVARCSATPVANIRLGDQRRRIHPYIVRLGVCYRGSGSMRRGGPSGSYLAGWS